MVSVEQNKIVSSTQIFLVVKGYLWLSLAVLYYYFQSIQILTTSFELFTLLLLLNALIAIFLAYNIPKLTKWYYSLTFYFLIANIILTFADQVGITDLAIISIDLILIVLLILSKKHYIFCDQ